MRSKYLIGAFLFGFVFSFFTAIAQNQPVPKKGDYRKEMQKVDKSVLPANSHDFIKTYFSKDEVVTVESDGRKMQFDVKLGSMTEIEFGKNGNWREIENNKGIAETVYPAFPEALVSYIKKNYPSNRIIKIDCEPYGYEVVINTTPKETSLYFDKKGNPLTESQKKAMKKQIRQERQQKRSLNED